MTSSVQFKLARQAICNHKYTAVSPTPTLFVTFSLQPPLALPQQPPPYSEFCRWSCWADGSIASAMRSFTSPSSKYPLTHCQSSVQRIGEVVSCYCWGGNQARWICLLFDKSRSWKCTAINVVCLIVAPSAWPKPSCQYSCTELLKLIGNQDIM